MSVQVIALLALAVVALGTAVPIGSYGGSLLLGGLENTKGLSGGESYASIISSPILTSSGLGYSGASYQKQEPEIIAYPQYAFKYGVEDPKTGDYKDQREERDGDVVKGEYTLLQPDGRRRVVKYQSDKKNGFNAIVSYSGHAVHPQEVKLVPQSLKLSSLSAYSGGSGLSSY